MIADTNNPSATPAPAPAPVGEDPQIQIWVRDAQAGNQAAMEKLITHFQDRIWRRARYRIGDHDEAWEVAQEVFIICFRKIGQFRGESQFWTWVARIVDNQVKNRQSWWRRRKQSSTFSLHDMYQSEDENQREMDPADPSPSPAQEVAGREAFAALEKYMGKLSEDHREILLLRFADGLAYEEIAEQLQISLGTVKSRINRARAELKDYMEEYL